MTPCSMCVNDPDICEWHPCNGCGDPDCGDCEVVINGFDCNMFERKEKDNG